MTENKKKLREQRNLQQVFELCGSLRLPCHVALSPDGSGHITADKKEIKDSLKLPSATSFMLETLPAMLDDHTITTICKVIGGLSVTRFRQTLTAFYNIWFADSPSLTFIKNITDRQSLNITDNC